MGALFEPFLYIIGLIVSLYFKIVIIEIILHWLIHFKILETSNKYSQKTMELLEKATHPVYNKIKEKFPAVVVSNFDLSPFVLWLLLVFVSSLIFVLSQFLLS